MIEVLEDGSLIAGEFCDDQPDGHIAIISPNAFSFMGKLENNDVNGEKNFLGQFLPKNQKLDHFDKGIGIVCGDDGTKYIGAFVEGKSSINSGQKHGFGIEINNRDCVYRGFWQYDAKHGEGILTGKKGDQLLQKWEDGKLNSQKKLG